MYICVYVLTHKYKPCYNISNIFERGVQPLKTIIIANQKGGVAKTATAAAILAGFNQRGKKTIAIDLDPQCNLTESTAAATDGKTIFGVLSGEITAAESIQTIDSIDIIASSEKLSAAESIFTETGKEYLLRESIEPIKKRYDYAIIDTPPTLNILTVAALTAADIIIIPAFADVHSISGITKLSGTIKAVKKYFNPKIKIGGILLTRYKANTTLSKEITELFEETAQQLGTKVYNTKIRECIKVPESAARQEPLLSIYPKSTAALDYNSFIDELLKGVKTK